MFKISSIQNEKEQTAYLEACGRKFRSGFFAYAMKDAESGELMAVAQFEIEKEEGYISDLCPVPTLDDFEAMFILGRSTMNFIDLCGAHKCRADKTSADERLLRAIGFKLRDDEYVADMTNMFQGHCDGHTKDLDKMK